MPDRTYKGRDRHRAFFWGKTIAKLRGNIVKLAKMLTDCMDAKTGFVKMDENRPEYRMLDALLDDQQAELMLKMGRRKPKTAEEIAKTTGMSLQKTQSLLDGLCDIGLVEYNCHNKAHQKQYVVPIFVVGSCENMVLNKKLMQTHPEVAEFFYQMGQMPLELIAGMIPPGGAGLGFHTIPIERAIPNDSQSLSIEKLSFWLKKYEKQLAICDCCCRVTMIARGEGVGELPDKGCIVLGDYGDYMIETGRAQRASYEEVIALLQRSEDNGFMHQVTNGDGRDDIFAICNCSVGNCFALRCSQLFNNQNASASAYRAVVDEDKCTACGKCAEVCPAGAVRLGRKLPGKNGPAVYEHEPLAGESLLWSEEHWHRDYRDRNQKNCYECGSSPCKAACRAHVSIQGVLELVKQERFLNALKLLRMDNPFPSLREHDCKHGCEMACMRKTVDSPMEISATITRLAAMQERYKDELIPKKARRKGEDKDYDLPVAVAGTGYDALSCAYYLAVTGYPVTVFGEDPPCSDAEKYIMMKLGVRFLSGEPDKKQFRAVYPDSFGVKASDAPSAVEGGRQAAESIHRFLHPGHSQTLARNPRDFRALNRKDVMLPAEKLRGHQCLSCGAGHVDPNRCIGCGICTTRCFFDAITLTRSAPEFADYCTADDTVKNVVVNGAKNAGKIAINRVKAEIHGSGGKP